MSAALTPIEALMWKVGHDSTLRMTVGSLIVVDQPPPPKALAERLQDMAERAPRLRRRPEELPGLRPRTVWADDEDFSIDFHLRTLSVASPGSMRQVFDLVSVLESVPFDPERSPWDVTVIEGLDNGRAALYLRAHHVLTDGLGGIRLLSLMLDERASPGPPVRSATPRAPGKPAAAAE